MIHNTLTNECGYKHSDDSVVQIRTFINFWTFFDTRWGKQFLKIFSNILCKQNSQMPGRTPNFSTSWSDSNFNCLPKWQRTQLSPTWPKVNLPTDSFSKSSNSQDHRFLAWRHSHSRPVFYLGFIMTIVIVISFARERKTVPNDFASELRAE